MNENKFDSKKLLIITGYILIVLIYAGIKNNINYIMGIINITFYFVLIKNEETFNKIELSRMNKIFYFLVFLGGFCIIIT